MAGAKFTSCCHSDQVVYKFPRAKASREKTHCCHINSVELKEKTKELRFISNSNQYGLRYFPKCYAFCK